MIKNQRYAVFHGEFENEKKKGQKNVDIPERGFEPQFFSKCFEFSWKVRKARSNQNKLLIGIGL